MPRARSRPAPPARRVVLLIATRKGLWTLTERRRAPRAGRSPDRSSSATSSITRVADPRDGKTLLAAARTGHLGPTVFRSTDRGRTWKEAAQPPAFKRRISGRTVDHTFWLTPGHASQPGVWYAGTSPQGLFRSADGGATWDRRRRLQRASASARRGAAATRTARPTARSCTRSSSTRAIPRICTSRCRAAACSNRPTPAPTGGRSTAACAPISCRCPIPSTATIRIACACAAATPTASISRTIAASIGSTGPASAGGHRRRHAEVGRRDRLSDGRASARSRHAVGLPDGWHRRLAARLAGRASPAAYRSLDGGKTWQRQDDGLPKTQAWWTVKRQAMTADARDPRASTSARRRARSGAVATKAAPGAASRGICRTSTRSRRLIALPQRAIGAAASTRLHASAHPFAAALVYRRRGEVVALPGLRRIRRRCDDVSRGARRALTRACASGSSTSRARAAAHQAVRRRATVARPRDAPCRRTR